MSVFVSAISSVWLSYRNESSGKVLADSLVCTHTDVGGSEQAWRQVENRVSRELQKLQYLVDASVDALRTPSTGRRSADAICTTQSNQKNASTLEPMDATGSPEARATEAERQRQQRRQVQEGRVQAMLAGVRKRDDTVLGAKADGIQMK